jgi:hypothetical protein
MSPTPAEIHRRFPGLKLVEAHTAALAVFPV